MSVTAINMVTTPTVDLLPNLIQIQTNDTLATVTAAGYINSQFNIQFMVPGGIGAFNEKQLALVYTTDSLTTMLSVSVANNGTITLSSPAEGSGIFASVTVGDGTAALPTINFSGDTTTGFYRVSAGVIGVASAGVKVAQISNSAFTMIGNLIAGASGTAGIITSYPATVTTGSLSLTAVANSGNYGNVLSNASTGQATTWSLPDPGSATANVLLNKGTNTMAAGGSIVLAKVNGTEAANAVTTDGQSGTITTSSLTVTAGSTYVITWTNTSITSTSTILLSWEGGTNTEANFTMSATRGTGTSTLTIYNNAPVTSISGTILIGYTLL